MVSDTRQVSRRLAAALGAALLLVGSGCAKPVLIYRWGVYESLVYDMYAKPGEADPVTQTAKLTEDIARTHAEGARVPPGVHAHLGFLYYSQGQVDSAYQEFAIEKQLFPESTVLIDGILDRMERQ
jgi:hypothetical protein